MHEVSKWFTFPTDFCENLTWNIIIQRCTKGIKHCARAVKWASLRRNSFRSGQTLSPARIVTREYFNQLTTFGALHCRLNAKLVWTLGKVAEAACVWQELWSHGSIRKIQAFTDQKHPPGMAKDQAGLEYKKHYETTLNIFFQGFPLLIVFDLADTMFFWWMNPITTHRGRRVEPLWVRRTAAALLQRLGEHGMKLSSNRCWFPSNRGV